MKNLVIVESPSKSKTIEKYLGSDYKVTSSKGHIRDLATSGKYGLGVDLENNFKPNYKVISGKGKLVTELKKEVKNSDYVILATDPDREGEAISWHLKDALGLTSNYGRVVFNEITEGAIKEAFKSPREIDMDLVHSQEDRRILDRIIGFRLSKLMQNKTEGKSAGRVQSVALKLIVDREREIEDFKSEEYFTIEGIFNDFTAVLNKYKNKKIEIKTKVEKDEILSKLSNAFKIESVESKEKKKSSKPVFTTSTLTQMASIKLGFSASKTMKLAQTLYEGKKIGNTLVGLISYMRTDSTRLSDVFVKDTFSFIKNNYGKDYVGYVKKTKEKENVQDAHEGIRPTSIERTPEEIREYLSSDEYKLYNLIYIRTLSSLMADARVMATSVVLDNNDYKFTASGQVGTFDGYLKVYKEFEESKDTYLPDFASFNSNVIVSKEIKAVSHFTEPPSRFKEDTLIKELESLGIGRPSTYVKIIEVLKERKYISVESKKFVPTSVGIQVTDKLQEYFSSIINVKYTSDMESDLDKVAEGELVWYELLDKFYKDFAPLVDEAMKKMEKEAPEETGQMCPECGKPLVYRYGKFGKFIACSGYPECKYIPKVTKEVSVICKCPECDGDIIVKRTKRGKEFYGCSNYPKCKYATWDKPTGEVCPKCNGLLVEKKGNVYCPKCKEEN